MIRLHPDDIQAIAEHVARLMKRQDLPVPNSDELAILAAGGPAALQAHCRARMKDVPTRKRRACI